MKKDRKGSRNIIHKSGNPKEEKREFLCKTIRGYLKTIRMPGKELWKFFATKSFHNEELRRYLEVVTVIQLIKNQLEIFSWNFWQCPARQYWTDKAQ